jgi:hypothetical protein
MGQDKTNKRQDNHKTRRQSKDKTTSRPQDKRLELLFLVFCLVPHKITKTGWCVVSPPLGTTITRHARQGNNKTRHNTAQPSQHNTSQVYTTKPTQHNTTQAKASQETIKQKQDRSRQKRSKAKIKNI